MNTNILLCGVGGQGTVLASKLLAEAGMLKGLNARTAETIGMAQRGGCVVSHVRIGDEKSYSPLIPVGQADVIIAFEPSEAVRNFHYLKKDGVVVVALKPIVPVTQSLSQIHYSVNEMLDFLKENAKTLIPVDTDIICTECNSPKVMNVALLGAAIDFVKAITYDDIKSAIKNRVKEKFLDMNFKALELGKQPT